MPKNLRLDAPLIVISPVSFSRDAIDSDDRTDPILYTSTSSSEQNRYLQLSNSPTVDSASGLKAGGVLVADTYAYANPAKNDLIVKGTVLIGTSSPSADWLP